MLSSPYRQSTQSERSRVRLGPTLGDLDLSKWIRSLIQPDREFTLQLCSVKNTQIVYIHCIYSVSQNNRTATINVTQLCQFTTFTNYFWHRDTLFNSPLTTIKSFFLFGLEPALCGFHNNSIDLTHLNSAFLGRLRTMYHVDRAINQWQNDCGAVSVPKHSIRTRVMTLDTAKHFTILIETLFKRFNFSVQEAAETVELRAVQDCYGNPLQLVLCCKHNCFLTLWFC